MSRYIDLKRIEFVMTNTCSGRCKHCSNGEHAGAGESVDGDAAVTAVKRLAERFAIQSVMTFGGEPLLFAETVCKIHAAACDCGISKRQTITNGYFSKNEDRINKVAEALCASGVNDILLSVDAFHQEFIPLSPVIKFAEALLKYGVQSLRVQPAWVVDEKHDNPYNAETKRLLKIFGDKGIRANKGNNIIPSGNALMYLAEYFQSSENLDLTVLCGSMPYTERLDNVSSISINPAGDIDLCSITIGNIYTDDVLKVVDSYEPYSNPVSRAVLNGGVPALLQFAESQGIIVDISDCRSACGVCHKTIAALKNRLDASPSTEGGYL